MIAVDRNLRGRLLRGVVLGIVSVLIAGRRYGFPSVNLDPSWGTGLLLGRSDGLSWGRELDFTYGPWGWLSVHIVINRVLLALSMLFTIAVSTYVILVIWKLLRRSISEGASLLIVVFVVLPFFSQVSITEVFLAGIFGSYVLLLERANRGVTESWKSIALLTMPVAFVLQLKISLGIFAFVGLVVVSAIWLNRAKLLAWCFGSLLGWFALFWLVSERSIAGVGEWTRVSLEIAEGFASAMSMRLGQPSALVLFVAFCVGSVLLLVRKIRMEKFPTPNSAIASALLAVTLYSALKTGYVREEQFRILDGYALCLPMWIWLLSTMKKQFVRYAVLALPAVVGMLFLMGQRPSVKSVSGVFDWPARVGVWVDNLSLLTSQTQYVQKASEARELAQSVYGLSNEMLTNLRDSSVQVDPFETTLVWAYSLRWKPVPIFQTYQAYAPGLDDVNTKALNQRSTSEVVLLEASAVKNINDRLSLWTPPRYQLALTCSWELVLRDGRWEEWRRTDRDCGSPENISTSSVAANQTVEIPRASASELVVATFKPTASLTGFLTRAFQFLYKPLDRFEITLDDVTYQQPRSFDGSPLIVSCPPDSAVTNRYEAVCPSPTTLTFSESGVVTFERQTVSPR